MDVNKVWGSKDIGPIVFIYYRAINLSNISDHLQLDEYWHLYNLHVKLI